MLITWHIDTSNYTTQQLEALESVVYTMDSSIANQLQDEINNKENEK